MKYKRIFLIVLDSFGIGNAPDVDKFGDFGANTLKSISKSNRFNIPNFKKLGLCNIDGVELGHIAENFAVMKNGRTLQEVFFVYYADIDKNHLHPRIAHISDL